MTKDGGWGDDMVTFKLGFDGGQRGRGGDTGEAISG